jgi:hypothetical protein
MATNSTQKTGFLEGILSAVGIVKSNNAKSNAKPVITTNNTSYNTSRKAHSHIGPFRPHTNNKRSAFNSNEVGFPTIKTGRRPYNTSMPEHLTSSYIKRENPTPKNNISNSTRSNSTSSSTGGSMYKKRHAIHRRKTRKHNHSK